MTENESGIAANRATLQAIEAALAIVKGKKAQALSAPNAVYDKLARITEYLEKEYRKTFDALCAADQEKG